MQKKERVEMNFKAVTGIMLILLAMGMIAFAFNINQVKADWTWTGTVYIRDNGSVDPDTTPISNMNNVTYTFTGNIYDEIVVERNNIIVDGAGYTLQGTGSGRGMNLTYRSNITIKNMKIKAFNYGIYLFESSDNIIQGNNVTENKFYGIYIGWGSSNNTISRNNVTNNNNGIVLYYSSNNFLQSNLLDGNQYGIGFLGLELSHFLHSINSSNLVEGKPIYYIISKDGLSISPSTHPEIGFLAIINSTNITVEGLTITKNRMGLLIVATNNTKIQNNYITNNVRGIVLYYSRNDIISRNYVIANGGGIVLSGSSNNTISGNDITMNSDGIELSGSSNNTITGNNVTDNEVYGVVLYDSSYNKIYDNNLIDNAQNVDVYGSDYGNFWDNGIEGNYWSDYEEKYPNATERDGSGIWDTPYVINENNQDNYPIVPEFPSFLILPLFMTATLLAAIFYRKKHSVYH